jgi:hypothetical protein
MRKPVRALSTLIIVLACNSCSITISTPGIDPDMAALKAILFAKEAFIDLNQPIAYDFLSEEMQRKLSLNKFIALIAQMHPVAFPLVVTATDYELIPGQESLFIWLYGENGQEKFYHRLTMVGNAKTDYRIASFVRMAELPPSQMRKPLPVRRSTNDDLR